MLKYLLYVIVNIPFGIFCYIFNPVIMLFAKNDNLPKWLSWCQTQDSPLDSDFIRSLFPKYPSDSWKDKYMRGLLWLYRNTGYDFAYDVLGCNITDDSKIVSFGNPDCERTTGRTGYYFAYDSSKPWYSRGWTLFAAYQYGDSKLCLRVFLGWKFKAWKEANKTGRAMLAMHINPISHFYK